ncbi:MAG: type II toxin-antitoxin system PemK/MazF family toxin, partial [Cryomorphaceae bacterium]
MKVKKFEIWLANLDPRMGTEAGKTRPVVVVQTDLLNRVHPST